MRFFLLSLRNAQHNRNRSITIAMFVGVSVLVYLLLNAFVSTAQNKTSEAITDSLLGHVQVRPNTDDVAPIIDMSADWGTSNHFTSTQVDTALDVFDRLTNVEATPVIRLNMLVGQVSNETTVRDGGEQVGVVAIGFRGEIDHYLQNLKLETGSGLGSGHNDEVVLSSSTASKLGVSPGDPVTLSAEAINGTVVTLRATLVGIGDAQSLSGFEDNLAYISFNVGQQLKGLAQGEATEVMAFGNSIASAKSLRGNVDETLGDEFLVTDWTTQGGFISGISTAFTGIFYVFLLILMVIVCILIVNMVAGVALERSKEIATLRAIGYDKTRIIMIFLIEVLACGAAGAIVAALLAWLIGAALRTHEFAVGSPADDVIGSTFTLHYSPLAGLPGTLVILMIVGLSSLIPSAQASSRNPAEALNED
ncbi:FtsX-like permease family [Propionibacterium ruminifibrarum]|uniref:FtsX-like permease family n=2 Tax=Propionibacterium ruminifibrarum TaxID=1962131 RepID=A0A375I4Y8_9ACTN|nr:FtsX-like permease family [Propionibacterium ruminifibrarum]